MQDILNYIESNDERYLLELTQFLKIPSVSSSEKHKPAMEKAAQWLKDNLSEAGLQNAAIIPTEGHSIVYADYLEAGEKAPTVLVYGHYDVQPVDPIELWQSDPFDPQIRGGKIFARGSSDDKGQVLTHVKAAEAFLKIAGEIPVNVKFLIEGEEEAGSSHLDKFVSENKSLLECDSVLISDTEWFADDVPSICYGLRGITFVEIEVKGPNRDLHSGTFGGGIDNPINVLCSMAAKMKDEYGRITVPGFYDEVDELTSEERMNFRKLPFYEEEYCDDLGIEGVNGEYGYTTLERVWGRPSLDLNGIVGGYTGAGAKTVLPSKASAKLSCRLVPRQNPNDIARKIEKYVKAIAPPTVKASVKVLHGGSPAIAPFDNPGIKAAKTAMREAFGKEPVFMREGGSIPIVETFKTELGAPSILLGLGLPGDNIHSPNENFDLKNYYGGIKASAIFMNQLAKETKTKL